MRAGGAGGGADEAAARRLRREVRALSAHEARVARAVAAAEAALARLSAEHGASAYITYADLRSIRDFRNQTVIPIKAPPDTRLSVSFTSYTGSILYYNRQKLCGPRGEINAYVSFSSVRLQ